MVNLPENVVKAVRTFNQASENYQLFSWSSLLARLLVVAYFFNQEYTALEIWYSYRQPFPHSNMVILPSICLFVFVFAILTNLGLTLRSPKASMLTNLGLKLRLASLSLQVSGIYALGLTLVVYFVFPEYLPAIMSFCLLLATVCVTCNWMVIWFSVLLAIIAFQESSNTLYHAWEVWWIQNGPLYINELMVKKLSLFGAVLLIVAAKVKDTVKSGAVAGLLLATTTTMSTRKSVALLIGRLLMSSLFLYVGITEIQRQRDSVEEHDGHVHRKRAEGDGHDQIVFKLIEFALSMPFIVGFKIKPVAILLAVALIWESFYSWSWWNSNLGIGYSIHAREHFHVNLGTAGGCILISIVGAGRYTVDELMKKKE